MTKRLSKPNITASSAIPSFAEIEQLDKISLQKHWKQYCKGKHFPKHLALIQLRKIVYYHMQESEYGALPAAYVKQLLSNTASVTEHSKSRRAIQPLPAALPVGTKLVRIWNGREYCVEVLENGFLFHDLEYRSLSAIAKAITGVQWSGPVFFGLKKVVHASSQSSLENQKKHEHQEKQYA